MARHTSDMLSLWTAPMEWARIGTVWTETGWHAQAVVAARMPIILAAMASPWTADYRELNLMVAEKVDAAGRSAQARSGKRLRAALGRPARPFDGPAAWFDMAERSVAVAAAMIALPGEMLKPFHTAAAANARRLGKRAT